MRTCSLLYERETERKKSSVKDIVLKADENKLGVIERRKIV